MFKTGIWAGCGAAEECGMRDAACVVKCGLAACDVQDAGFRMQDAGCGMQDAGCGMRGACVTSGIFCALTFPAAGDGIDQIWKYLPIEII